MLPHSPATSEMQTACSFSNLVALEDEHDFFEEANKLYGRKSLAELMDMGIADLITGYMVRECETRAGFLKNILLLINMLLPGIPEDIDSHYYYRISEITDGDVEEFARRLINEMVFLLKHSGGKFSDMFGFLHFQSALLKTMYFAPLECLSNTLLLDVGLGLGLLGEIFLNPKCSQPNLVYVSILAIIDLRLPGAIKKEFFSTDIVLMLRRLGNISPLASELYEKYEMENLLMNVFPNWSQISKISQYINNGEIKLAFDALTVIINKNETDEIIASDLLPSFLNLTRLFFVDVDCMKSFEQFIIGQPEESLELVNFRKLVDMIKRSIISIYNDWISSTKHDYNICREWTYCRHFDNLLETAVHILQDLHSIQMTLNRLDEFIAAGQRPLDNSEFHCVKTRSDFDEYFPRETDDDLIFLKNLASKCPVMFPLEVRRHFFRILVQDRYFLNSKAEYITLNRTNVLLHLHRIINDVMPEILSKPWNVSFKDEIGQGRGLNRELFSLISKEFQRHDLGLWFGEPVSDDTTTKYESDNSPQSYTHSPNGLFPKGVSQNSRPMFRLLGQLMAKALIDEHLIDIPLSLEFFKYIRSGEKVPNINLFFDIIKIVPETSKIIKQLLLIMPDKMNILKDDKLSEETKFNLINNLKFDGDCSFEDLCVNFTMPGSGEELIEGGKYLMLSPINMDGYLNSIVDFVLKQNLANFEQIRCGIDEVFCCRELAIFLPEELQSILCGQEYKPWSTEYLKSCCSFANGYDASSKAIAFLFEILSTFNASEQRKFIKFVSGTPRLPIGGLESLSPRLTISKYSTEDIRLPSASTCYNLLHLPEYSSLEKTREKLMYVLSEGDDSFQYI